jgi:hypothetical protein
MLPKDSGPFLTLPSSGHAITNSAQIVRHAFTTPNETTLLVPPAELAARDAAKPVEKAKARPAARARSEPARITPGTIVLVPLTIGC